MLLTYTDDSGERGVFVLATVIVDELEWLAFLDAWTDYRRWLRDEFGLRIYTGHRARKPVEIHSTDFATGAGEWRHVEPRVGLDGRMKAFRQGLKLIGRRGKVFAVAWMPDREMSDRYRDERFESPANDCWRHVLERLATYSGKSAGGQRIATNVDRGYGEQFSRVLRKMRRYHRVGSLYGGSLPAHAPMLLDDPSTRDSKSSAFVQMADMCAYAALRELRPEGQIKELWNALGPGIVRDVNIYKSNQPPGIKLIPY